MKMIKALTVACIITAAASQSVAAATPTPPIPAPNSQIAGVLKVTGSGVAVVTVAGVVWYFDYARRNWQTVGRETSVFNKALKATTGISKRDIKKHGIWGGPNSFFRKPFG